VLDPEERRRVRQSRARPVSDALYEWLVAQRKLVSEGSAISRAIDYSLKRWEALTRYLDDGHVPIDNNWVGNQIRRWAIEGKLAVRRLATSRTTRCCDHELATLGATQRARPVRLSERHPHAAADSQR
jgi:hypothetical protein